jgi:hypothetical protein
MQAKQPVANEMEPNIVELQKHEVSAFPETQCGRARGLPGQTGEFPPRRQMRLATWSNLLRHKRQLSSKHLLSEHLPLKEAGSH